MSVKAIIPEVYVYDGVGYSNYTIGKHRNIGYTHIVKTRGRYTEPAHVVCIVEEPITVTTTASDALRARDILNLNEGWLRGCVDSMPLLWDKNTLGL